MSPTFCLDAAPDFFKIDEKIIEKGIVADLQRSRGCDQKFSFIPPLL